MTTPENLIPEDNREINGICPPSCTAFFVRMSHGYCEFGVLFGLAFMLVAGVTYLDSDTAYTLPMVYVGLFGVFSGAASGVLSKFIDEHYEVETEQVTLNI